MTYSLYEISLAGNKGQTKVKACFDMRFPFTIINQNIADKICQYSDMPFEFEISTVNDNTTVKAAKWTSLAMSIGNMLVNDSILVSEKINVDMIVGCSTIERSNIKTSNSENQKSKKTTSLLQFLTKYK